MSTTGRTCRRLAALGGAMLACAVVIRAQPQAQELIVRNGLIVTVDGRRQADLLIRNGTVAEVGRNLTAGAGAREIDARGMLVIPGGVDPHSHLTPERPATVPPGTVMEDYTSGSMAALAGGVTTVTNFVSRQGDENVSTFLDRTIAQVEKAATFWSMSTSDAIRRGSHRRCCRPWPVEASPAPRPSCGRHISTPTPSGS